MGNGLSYNSTSDPPSRLVDSLDFYTRKYQKMLSTYNDEHKEIEDLLQRIKMEWSKKQREQPTEGELLHRQRSLEFEIQLLEFRVDWLRSLHITWSWDPVLQGSWDPVLQGSWDPVLQGSWDPVLQAVSTRGFWIKEQSRFDKIGLVITRLEIADRKFCSELNNRLQRSDSLQSIIQHVYEDKI